MENGRIRGVKTSEGEMATPIVVNAAGPWAARIGEMVGIEIPVVPVRRQIAVTTPIPQLPTRFPLCDRFCKEPLFSPGRTGHPHGHVQFE